MPITLRSCFLLVCLIATHVQSSSAQVCTPSTPDAEWDNYLENAPERSVLFSDNEGQKPLRIAGTLIDHNCQPISNATVEVWGATPEGCYSGQSNCNDRGDPYFLRGLVRTDGQGRFTVTTLSPGKHLTGERMRPAHINLRIRSANNELTTQIYFEGDELIASDPSASHPQATDRVLIIYEEGAERAVIPTLTMNTTASILEEGSEEIRVYPMYFSDHLKIRGTISPGSSATLLDIHGRILLKSESVRSDQDLFSPEQLKRLGFGVYFLQLEEGNEQCVFKVIKR